MSTEDDWDRPEPDGGLKEPDGSPTDGIDDIVRKLRERALQDRYRGPQPMQVMHQGLRFRAVGSRVFPRPPEETFHDFLFFHLKFILGKQWLEAQKDVLQSERHVVVEWLAASDRLRTEARPAELRAGEAYGVEATGEVKELLVLANDVLKLVQIGELPGRLLKRLRDRHHFQGARYELAIAATFMRAGFHITWVHEKSQKHPELTATHKTTGETIAVETKSRHRAGVLHQPGERSQFLQADVEKLLGQALAQAPGTHPFAIFIDLNLPHESTDTMALMEALKLTISSGLGSPAAVDPFALLVFTNLGAHYEEDRPGAPGQYVACIPATASPTVKDPATLRAVLSILAQYGAVIEDE